MKNKKNDIDIILPNYNSHKFIKQSVESVICQSFTKWKLYIIDDSSDNATKKILKKYERNKKIKIFWLKKNKGAAYCRNYAIQNSNSRFIAFLDSDDIWNKRKLELQIKFMKKNNYKFSYTNYKTFGKKQKLIRPKKNLNFLEFIRNTSIATSSMILERKVTKGIRFTNTKICEDYFYKCQALKKIGKAYKLDKYLLKYRIRKDSLQSNNVRNIYWIWKINKLYNKLNFIDNFLSIFFISLNSIKKYGGKNLY